MSDNELIAEFMGHKPGTATNHPLDFNYHESYDCLMPVVEKINSLDNYTAINIDSTCTFVHYSYDRGCKQYNNNIEGSKINALYKAVVEFIKWYNKNGKEKT